MSVQNKLIVSIFILFIFGMSILNILDEDRSFSEQENRYLSTMPSFTWKGFLSGSFTKEFEKYVTDQFVWKSAWLNIKASAEKMSLKKENNGVFLGRDGYLLERFDEPNEQLKQNIQNVNYFASKTNNIRSYLLLAPTAVEIYKDKLPLFASSFSQKKVLTDIENKLQTSIRFIDVYDGLLSKKQDYIYFKSDHHWTMRGAYQAYKETAVNMGIKPNTIEDFDIKTVSENFKGTLYSKANAYHIKPDKIELFSPKFDVSYTIDYVDLQKSTDSLYEWSYLKKKDQYSFFLNGNHSLMKISSSIQNGRKLLVIKDSYAHTFIPFLANHFEEIHVVDLRYFNANIYSYIEANKINETLFLYNLANFSKDSNLIWLRQ